MQMINKRLDTNCDGEVDLSEYLTYILFEHQEKEIMFSKSKSIPYTTNPKVFTTKNLPFDLFVTVSDVHTTCAHSIWRRFTIEQ
jgi:hypothetical protein